MTNQNLADLGRSPFRGGLTATMCIVSLCLSGCGKGGASTTTSAGAGKTARSSTDCANSLANVWGQVQPERLGLSSDKATVLPVLNSWLSDCGLSQLKVLVDEEPALKRALLSEAQKRRVVAQRFSARDIEHLRDVIVFRDLADQLMGLADNDVDRLVAVFDYVVRNIDLVAADDDRPALTPFELLMLGQGTAADRAWVFAEILRQASMDDAVIVRPANFDGEAWLLGAFAGDQLLLFEPQLGLAIPSVDDDVTTPIPRKPAALQELAADGEVLGAFGDDYPLNDKDFSSFEILAVGESSFWSHRAQVLQAELSGDRAVVLYDPFDDETENCQMERLTAMGGDLWSRDAIGLWDYPEKQMTAAELRDEAMAGRVDTIMGSFDVPLSVQAQATMRGRILEMQDRQDYDSRKEETRVETVVLIEHEAVEDLIPPARTPFVVEQDVLADFVTGEVVRFELFIGPDGVTAANFEVDDSSEAFRGTVTQDIEKERDQYKTRVKQITGQIDSAVVSGYQQVRLQSSRAQNLVGNLKTFYDDAAQDAMFWSGMCQFENEEYESSITTFYTYLRTHPEARRQATARLLVGRILAGQKKWAKAAEALEPTIDADEPQKAGNAWLHKRWKAQASAE